MHQVIKSSVSTCFELHLETTRTSQSRDNRRCGKIYLTLGILLQILFHLSHYLIDSLSVTCTPRFQNNSQFTACLAATHTGATTYYALNIFYSRIQHQIFYSTFRYDSRTLQCRTFRQFQFHFKVSLIFYRQKAGRYQAVYQQNSYQYHTKCTQYPAGITYHT